MLIVSPSTASALAPHARERSWVMFVQAAPLIGLQGPIKIEGVRGSQLAHRLGDLAAENAFDVQLIGLLETTEPDEHADAIAEQYIGSRVHDEWFHPTPGLLTFIQTNAQTPLAELLAQTHPAGLPDVPVGIEEMAALLDVSVSTVRRMVNDKKIPCLRWGKILRFVPADVVASLQQGR